MVWKAPEWNKRIAAVQEFELWPQRNISRENFGFSSFTVSSFDSMQINSIYLPIFHLINIFTVFAAEKKKTKSTESL